MMIDPMRSARILLGVVLLIVGACSGPRQPSSPDVIAAWDQGEITQAQLDSFILEQPAGRRIPPEDMEQVEWLGDQAERLFQRQVVLADDGLAGLLDDQVFAGQLKAAVVAAQAKAFLTRHDRRDIVTREEAEAFYHEHKRELLRPERRAFRSLFLEAADGKTIDDLKVEAEALRSKALGGASFEALVIAHSDSSNAEFGGLVGPVERSDLRGIVGRTVFDLEVGEVSQVIASSGGVLLFQLSSLEPASEDNFEVHFPAIAEKISVQRRQAWRQELAEEQAVVQGVDLPSFDDADLALMTEPATVVFEIDGIQVVAADVFADGASVGLAARARRLVEDALFASAFRRGFSQEAEAVGDRVLRSRGFERLLREALFAEVDSWPEEDFLGFFEANESRFTTTAQVELTVFSWPLGGRDPVEEARRPQAFADALGRGEGRGAWALEEVLPGVRKENVRLVDLRTLAARAPWIVSRLTGTVEEGQVIGPFRFGPRLWVMSVDTYVAPRQMSYEEARPQIPANILATQWREVFVKWSEHLAAERDFVVFPQRLEAFGSSVLDFGGATEAGLVD